MKTSKIEKFIATTRRVHLVFLVLPVGRRQTPNCVSLKDLCELVYARHLLGANSLKRAHVYYVSFSFSSHEERASSRWYFPVQDCDGITSITNKWGYLDLSKNVIPLRHP
jgi:hypothetical protein